MIIIQFWEAIFGCLHRHMTFPLTPNRVPGVVARAATYVTCLDCGRSFHYLWDEMRIGQPVQVAITPRSGAVQSPILDKETNIL